MANAIKWEAIWTSRGNVITTELNSLADGGFATGSSGIANGTNLDQYACCEITLAALSPSAGAFVTLYVSHAPDGSTYGDPPSATNPGGEMSVAVCTVETTDSDAKVITTPIFRIPPSGIKFTLKNNCGVSLASTGNTVELFTCNDEVQ